MGGQALERRTSMPIRIGSTGRIAAGAALLVAIVLAMQISVALAAASDTYALPAVVAQATATPFRFLTPTPFAPRTTTTTTTGSTAPRAGGFPMELALPALAGGLAAIGGGSFLLRRRATR
jgi:hypothetical protein